MYHGIVCLVHHPGIGELIMTRRIGLLAYGVLSALLCLGAAPLSPLRVSDNTFMFKDVKIDADQKSSVKH